MAQNDDLTEQLELTKKITAQMQQMAVAAEKMSGSFSSQAATVEKLAGLFTKVDAAQANTGVASVSKTLRDVGDTANKTDKQFKTLFEQMAQRAEKTGGVLKDKFAKQIFVATAALKGMQQGFKTVIALGQGFTSFLYSVVDGLANVAASIIAIPFKMLQGLIDMGAKAFTGMSELMVELEKLRKQFGAFSSPTNKAIISTATHLEGFKATGLSAWRVFGTLAERLQYIGELAKEMGGAFNSLRKEMEQNGGAILAYQKGLGIANEDMKQLMRNSVSSGVKMSDTLKDMTKYSLEMGKSFKSYGIDAKVISREMAQAATDVKHFGGASTKQIAEASTFAHGLGLELKDIVGTLDKFDTFDQAAENAAKLGQAFGVNLDAFKLMNAQSPAEQVDMMRKAFRAAGKDASTMGRAELKLLAQTTGLDEGVAKTAFSLHNQGLSLDEIKKKSGDASKKTLTQEQAMGQLADAIERMVKAGQEMKGGFFDAFFDGIKRGMMSSREFYGMMMNIHMALQQVMMVGVRLGRELVHIVPGLSDILGGLKDFFQPKKFSEMFEGISTAVKRFFDPTSADKGSIPNLVKGLRDVIEDMFSKEGSSGKKILDGFQKFFEMAANVAGDVMVFMSDHIADGIKYVIDLLTGKKSLNVPGSTGTMGFLGKFLDPIIKGLQHAWTVLSPAVWDLVVTLGDKLVDFIKKPEVWDKVKKALYVAGAIILVPALVKGLSAQVGVMLMKGIVSSVLKKGVEKSVEGAVEQVASKVGGRALGVAGKIAGPAAIVAAAAAIGDGVSTYTKEVTSTLDHSSAVIAAGATGLVDALTLGLLPKGLSKSIANSLGGIVDQLFEGIKSTFGTGFAESLKRKLSSSFEVLGSVWDLLKNIFTGDQASVDKSVKELGLAVVRFLVSAFEFAYVQVPLMLGRLAVRLFAAFEGTIITLVGTIASGLALAVDSVFGTDLQKKVTEATDKVHSVMNDAAEGAARGLETVGNAVSSASTKIQDTYLRSSDDQANEAARRAKATATTTGSMAAKAAEAAADETKGSMGHVAESIQTVKDVKKQLEDSNFDLAGAISLIKVKLKGVDFKFVTDEQAHAFIAATSLFKDMAPAIDMIKDVVKRLAEIPEAFEAVVGSGGNIDIVTFNAYLNDLTNSLMESNVSVQLPGLKVALASFGELAHVIKGEGEASGLIGSLTQVRDLVSLANDLTAVISSSKVNAVDIASSIVDLVHVASIVNDNVPKGGVPVGGLIELSTNLPTIMDKLTDVSNAVANKVGSGQGLSNFQKNMTMLAETLKGGTDKNTGITAALSAVTEMVKQVNALDSALGSNTNKIDIKAKLENVARSVGLGASGQYSVKHGDVNITVNLQVTMDATKVESAILSARGSIIADRVNYVTNEAGHHERTAKGGDDVANKLYNEPKTG